MTIDDAMNKGDLVVVYIEDADTNGNRLPDAWEMYVNGGDLSNGSADIDATLDCGLAVKASITDNLPDKQIEGAYNGMVAHYVGALKSRGMVALALGVPPDVVNVNSAGQIVVDNKVESVEVESISFEGGSLSIKVSGTVGTASDGVSSDVYSVTVVSEATKTVVCDVYRRDTLSADDDWTLVTSSQVTVGADAAEIPVPGAVGESGFYKVVIRQ